MRWLSDRMLQTRNILAVQDQKVLLDTDITDLYQVKMKDLTRQVCRMTRSKDSPVFIALSSGQDRVKELH